LQDHTGDRDRQQSLADGALVMAAHRERPDHSRVNGRSSRSFGGLISAAWSISVVKRERCVLDHPSSAVSEISS